MSFQLKFKKNVACLGIADGVGGQRDFGIDPRRFAVSLIEGLKAHCDYVLDQPQSLLPSNISAYLFNNAYYYALQQKVAGSSTFISAWIDRKANTIDVSLIGDCKCVIYRQASSSFSLQAIRSTHGVMLKAGYPKQLGDNFSVTANSSLRATPGQAEYRHFELQPNDYVLMGSDGLFDNLFDETIIEILLKHGIENAVPQLIHQAYKASTQFGEATPFNKFCGKTDDISVILYQHKSIKM